MAPSANSIKKIHIAGGRAEVICPHCRAKHFQAAYVEALANSGDAGTVLGDSGVHGLIDDFKDTDSRHVKPHYIRCRLHFTVLIHIFDPYWHQVDGATFAIKYDQVEKVFITV